MMSCYFLASHELHQRLTTPVLVCTDLRDQLSRMHAYHQWIRSIIRILSYNIMALHISLQSIYVYVYNYALCVECSIIICTCA